jgi:hypothetical protein
MKADKSVLHAGVQVKKSIEKSLIVRSAGDLHPRLPELTPGFTIFAPSSSKPNIPPQPAMRIASRSGSGW